MKRSITVLAMALILILTTWESASSMRYPNVTIDVVHYDHPWGGEQNVTDPPSDYSTTSTLQEDFIIVTILKYWNYRFLYNTSLLIKSRTNVTTTTTTTNTTTTDTNSSETTSQRGMGQ